ncbi:hypothetical protein, partial [Alloprevotella tannerae]|uniref:hypothetical protein n=1 Tax=Alloprevotella tannerae TaxID=76122 RepID=UPI00361FF1FE
FARAKRWFAGIKRWFGGAKQLSNQLSSFKNTSFCPLFPVSLFIIGESLYLSWLRAKPEFDVFSRF